MVTRVRTNWPYTNGITPGKWYQVFNEHEDTDGGNIIDDDGTGLYLYYPSCAHIEDNAWEVSRDEDLPIT